MNRRNFMVAAGALAVAPRVGLMRRDLSLPRAYFPQDARPYYHPRFDLRQEHVDPLIWPVVQRINQSGWVWTLESCQGHGDRQGRYGASEWPMVRLAVHHGLAARMLGLLHRSIPIGDPRARPTYCAHVFRHVEPPMRGWFEARVAVGPAPYATGPATDEIRGEARAMLGKFAEAVNR